MNLPMSLRTFALSLFALSACAAESGDAADTPDNVAMFEDVLSQHQALNDRVERVAFQLLSRSVRACDSTTRTAGFTAHTLRDYPTDLRALARTMMDVDDGISVRSVVPGSPADAGGLMTGDAIQQVGDSPVPRTDGADRIWAWVERVELQSPEIDLRVSRAGKPVTLSFPTVRTCDYPVGIIFSELPNAFTDGEEVFITSELVRNTASDSRLALILAHELAHAIDHGQGTDFKVGPDAELEADARGLALIHAAGFDVDAAIDEMESFGRTLMQEGSTSHPIHAERVAALRALAKTLN